MTDFERTLRTRLADLADSFERPVTLIGEPLLPRPSTSNLWGRSTSHVPGGRTRLAAIAASCLGLAAAFAIILNALTDGNASHSSSVRAAASQTQGSQTPSGCALGPSTGPAASSATITLSLRAPHVAQGSPVLASSTLAVSSGYAIRTQIAPTVLLTLPDGSVGELFGSSAPASPTEQLPGGYRHGVGSTSEFTMSGNSAIAPPPFVACTSGSIDGTGKPVPLPSGTYTAVAAMSYEAIDSAGVIVASGVLYSSPTTLVVTAG